MSGIGFDWMGPFYIQNALRLVVMLCGWQVPYLLATNFSFGDEAGVGGLG